MNSSNRNHFATALLSFALISAPSAIAELTPAMTLAASHATQSLDSALLRMIDLERSRAAGWMTPGEFASRVRHDVIPPIASSVNYLKHVGHDDLAATLEKKRIELETVSLIFEAKDHLFEAERSLRKRQFDFAMNRLNDFWVSTRPKFSELKPFVKTYLPDVSESYEKDSAKLLKLAFKLEVLMTERHLAGMKVTLLTPSREPAANELTTQLEIHGVRNRLLIERLNFVSRVYPEGDAAALRNKINEVGKSLCTGADLC